MGNDTSLKVGLFLLDLSENGISLLSPMFTWIMVGHLCLNITCVLISSVIRTRTGFFFFFPLEKNPKLPLPT